MFDTLFSIYALILMGFVAIRTGYLPAAGTPHLVAFALRIYIPLLVFFIMLETERENVLNFPLLLAYGVGSLLSFFVAYGALSYTDTPRNLAAIMSMGASCSNSILIGLPIAGQIFPDDIAQLFATILIVENLCMIPLGIMLSHTSTGVPDPSSYFRQIITTLKNPILLGLLAGLLGAMLGMQVWTPLRPIVTGLHGTALILSLFLVGALIAANRNYHIDRAGIIIIVIKMAFHPIIIALCLLMTDITVGGSLYWGFVFFAGLPMFTVFTLLAAPLETDARAATAYFWAISGSIVTIGGFLYFYGGDALP